MADTRRLVSINPLTGAVSILRDFQTGANYAAERGSFTVKQGDRRQQFAQVPTRYGGAHVVGETHDNDHVSWKAIVSGSAYVLSNAGFELPATAASPVPGWAVTFTGATQSAFAVTTAPSGFTPTEGYACLSVGASSAANATQEIKYLENGARTPVVAGRTYTLSADTYVRTAIANSNCAVRLYWFKADGTASSTASNTSATVSRSTTGLKQPTLTATAPSDAASVQIALVDTTGATAGALSSYWDNVIFVDNSETADSVIQAVEALLALGEDTTRGRFIEWAPEDAAASTYYEIAGPASFDLDYDWVVWKGTKSMIVTIDYPVRPLAQGEMVTQTLASSTAPASWNLTAIQTGAKAKADVIIRANSPSNVPAWGLLTWTRQLVSNGLSGITPFGLIEGEAATGMATLAVNGSAGATFHNSSNISVATSGAGSGYAYWSLDISQLYPDDFTDSTVDVEIWARVACASSVTSPKLTASLQPTAGANYGPTLYTQEYGSGGKLLYGGATNALRIVRLGTITAQIDKTNPSLWDLRVDAAWDAGSSGTLAIDYLFLNPARQRLLGRTGVSAVSYTGPTPTNNSGFPLFIPSTNDTRRWIRSDGTSYLSNDGTHYNRVAPLGGGNIELSPGVNTLALLLSSGIPDDPAAVSSDAVSYTNISGTVNITPRYNLLGRANI